MFVERIKIHKGWKDAETNLTKKREAKVKLELANKTDKIPQATAEVKEVREMHRIGLIVGVLILCCYISGGP